MLMRAKTGAGYTSDLAVGEQVFAKRHRIGEYAISSPPTIISRDIRISIEGPLWQRALYSLYGI